MNRHFKLILKDDIVRGMNREQYKAASHWIRSVCRLIEAGISWELVEKQLADVVLFGRSEISFEDLLNEQA